MAREDDGYPPVWKVHSPQDEPIGADIRDIPFSNPVEFERVARRIPHPAIPALDTLHASRRSFIWISDMRTEDGFTRKEAHDPDGNPVDFGLCVYQFIEQTCFQGDRIPNLDADVNLRQLLDTLDGSEAGYWKAAVVARAYDDSARAFADRLSKNLNYWLPVRLGFDPDDPPTHSTLSRHWQFDEETEAAIEELAIRARYAGLWASAEFPAKLREKGWGREEILSSEVTLEEKLVAMKHLIEEGVAVISPHLSFGRDPDAPAFKLPPAAFLTLFAHLALENSYLNTGTRTLEWMDLPAPVPSPGTVSQYTGALSVEDIDEMFGKATAALLKQEQEQSVSDSADSILDPPVHLAYDTTKVEWYGDRSTPWTSGVLPRDNSASAWVFAVLAIVDRDMSYVLGALPLRSQTEIGEYLRRFLRRATGMYDLDIGRVYLDSELYTETALTALRESDVDFLIQAKDTGAVSDLLDAAVEDEPEYREGVSFGDFPLSRKPNAFAWPVPDEVVGAGNRDRSHEAFLTDMDVKARSLEGLGHEFRARWGVETSIREIKRRYHAKCKSSKPSIRAFYFMMATILYNLSQYVDNRLADRLYTDEIEWSGEELLHATREVRPGGVPDWGGAFDPAEADDWVGLR
ncbi:transposase [Haloarcula sp. Atlit-7R]|uniref:transposase n=1 Tax=Haloarcula sp. Atlit-7R TaxID=2282125 RepID=UPI001F190C25|nr:transposase [Haloarcula sp. Atlit-7R]